MATNPHRANPHFVRGPDASIDPSSGKLIVSWKEVGLGNTPVTYRLMSLSQGLSYRCVTKETTALQGEPKNLSFSSAERRLLTSQTCEEPYCASATIAGPGQITASLSLDYVSYSTKDDLCPGEAVPCFMAVDYGDITFQDETNLLPMPPADLGFVSIVREDQYLFCSK